MLDICSRIFGTELSAISHEIHVTIRLISIILYSSCTIYALVVKSPHLPSRWFQMLLPTKKPNRPSSHLTPSLTSIDTQIDIPNLGRIPLRCPRGKARRCAWSQTGWHPTTSLSDSTELKLSSVEKACRILDLSSRDRSNMLLGGCIGVEFR